MMREQHIRTGIVGCPNVFNGRIECHEDAFNFGLRIPYRKTHMVPILCGVARKHLEETPFKLFDLHNTHPSTMVRSAFANASSVSGSTRSSKEMRSDPFAASPASPMAVSTWLAFALALEQAEPAETQKPC